jgi:hypothetical protein
VPVSGFWTGLLAPRRPWPGNRQPPRLVEILLEAGEHLPNLRCRSKLQNRVRQGAIPQLEQRRQLVLVQLLKALGDVVREHEVQEGSLLLRKAGVDGWPRPVGALLARDARQGKSNIGQNVVEIRLLSLQRPLNLGQLRTVETLVLKITFTRSKKVSTTVS